MPLYEYYCRYCEAKFELLRPMSRRDEPATCASGHQGAQRVLSVFAAFSQGERSVSTTVGGSSACGGCVGGRCSACGSH